MASELEPDPTAPWRPQVTNALGMTAFWSGAFQEAETAFAETVSAGDPVGYYAAEIYALGYLAAIAAERAERAEADRRVARARVLAERQALGEHWVTVMVYYAAGELARARRGAATGAGRDRARAQHRPARRAASGHRLRAAGAGADRRGGRRASRGPRPARPGPAPAGRLHRPRLPGGRVGAADVADPGSRPAAADSIDELSERELAVLRLLSSQLSLREIGNELYVSLNTIKTHARNIYAKLRVSSREQAVVRARELGLLRRAE